MIIGSGSSGLNIPVIDSVGLPWRRLTLVASFLENMEIHSVTKDLPMYYGLPALPGLAAALTFR